MYPTVQFDIDSLIPYIPSPRGAQMGRDEWGIVDVDSDECKYAATRITLYGDYDKGGVYWGNNGKPVYCLHTVDSDEVQQFDRADNAEEMFNKFQVPMHLRVTVEVPPLTFDCGECGQMDVTAILELFDTDQVYVGDLVGQHNAELRAFNKAKLTSEEWTFTPQAYKSVREWWAGMGGDGPLTDQEARAIVLQEIAHLYHELESHHSDLDEDDDEFIRPLAMLRQAEWSDECECPVDLSIGDDGKIYYSFSG